MTHDTAHVRLTSRLPSDVTFSTHLVFTVFVYKSGHHDMTSCGFSRMRFEAKLVGLSAPLFPT